MTFRFRRTLRLFPGVRLNLSKSGISASIGGSPFTMNVGPRGLMGTAGIPGTGLSFRQHLSTATHADDPLLRYRPASAIVAPETPPGDPIHSGPLAEITSDGLATLLKLLKEANAERREIEGLLPEAEKQRDRLHARHERWAKGFLWRRLMPGRFARLGENAAEATAHADELRAHLQHAVIATEIEAPLQLGARYVAMREAFQALCGAHAIWDAVAERKVDRRAERSSAVRILTREPVTFELGRSDILGYADPVPTLHNKNGGDLFLYPGFVLYKQSDTEFGLIDLRDLKCIVEAERYVEYGTVPDDAQKVGTTWLRVNADGSPDRRFHDNPEIPIMEYGALRLESAKGLREEYQVSNSKLAAEFGKALQGLIDAAKAGA